MADKLNGPPTGDEGEEEVPPTERLTKGTTSAGESTGPTATISKMGGDAKIDIQITTGGDGGGAPTSGGGHGGLVGMTKKELMRYANDPFWIRLRRSLFVLFWLVWFGMLFASVFIIWDAISHGGCNRDGSGSAANSTAGEGSGQ